MSMADCSKLFNVNMLRKLSRSCRNGGGSAGWLVGDRLSLTCGRSKLLGPFLEVV